MPDSVTSPLGSLSVAQKPRVSSHPPYVDSFGPEAIELARLAGLILDPWQCDALTIMLGVRADGKWACFEYCEMVPRQNGKGAILEARVLAGLLLLGEELILWSAHEYKTAMEAFRRFLRLIARLGTKINENLYDIDGLKIKVVHTNGEEGFERLPDPSNPDDHGQRVKFIARSKSSGRGFTGDVNIIDEAFAFTGAQQSALMPTMSARSVEGNPQFIFMSSPPLDGESGDVLYRLRERGEAGDDSLGWRDWGLPGDLSELNKICLHDPKLWGQVNPSLTIRISTEFVSKEHRSMSPEDFARERLGVWPRRIGTGGGAINKELWDSLLDKLSKRVGDVTIALDITPSRDWATIGLYGMRADGLGHVQILDRRPGTHWIIARLVEWKKVLDPVAIVIDEKNGSKALVRDLKKVGIAVPKKPEQPERGDLLITTADDMAMAVGQILDAIAVSGLRYPDGQGPLTAAAENAKLRPIGDGGAVAFGRRISNVDIGPLLTITLARYGQLTRLPLLECVGPNVW